MPKPKFMHQGAWVRTSMLSQSFAPVSGICEDCRRGTAGPVYLHLYDHRVLCKRCFRKRFPDD